MNLSELNIYGLDAIMDLLAAGIFSGEPVCLIGEKGTAKTFMCRQVARALGVEFISYNASTINFEDVVGYPIPRKNEETGDWEKMDFIPTKTSIWNRNFILIDELNRARIDRQNDLLQLIRNRAVQGIPVDELTWVWAAVNPLSYEGTSAMDEAMADRFSWIVRVPSFLQIQHDDRMSIIHNVTDDDMPAIGHWDPDLKPEVNVKNQLDFNQFFKRVAKAYKDVKTEFEEAVGEYVEQVALALSKRANEKVFLDGRRVGMLKRNIMTLAAVHTVMKGELVIENAAAKALWSSFPHELIGDPIPSEHLQAAHAIAKEYLVNSTQRDLIKVRNIEDPIERVAAIFSHNLDPMDGATIITEYYNELSDFQKVVFSLALYPKIVGNHEDKITTDIMATIAGKVETIARQRISTPAMSTYSQIKKAADQAASPAFFQYCELIKTVVRYGAPSVAEIAQAMGDHMKVFRNIKERA